MLESTSLTDVTAGAITVTVEGCLDDYAGVCTTTTFTYTVTACAVTSITKSGDMTALTYTILDDVGSKSESFLTYTYSPACEYSYSFEIKVNDVVWTSP
jgi:hypothetical protein